MEECIRCSKPLASEEDFQTGICAECWTEEDEEV
jgi:DNA-directed RNA polymerase subunit RPC12/RpoP